MKEKILWGILGFFPVLLFAQKEPSPLNADLETGQVFELEKASVKFLKVISDSRCPKQVTCIWSGEAKVLLGINVDREYFEKEVVVSGTGGGFAISEDIQVLVSHLRPYPQTAMPIAPEDYCLRIAAVAEKEN